MQGKITRQSHDYRGQVQNTSQDANSRPAATLVVDKVIVYIKTGFCITRVQNAQSIPVPDLHFSSCVRYAQTIPSAHHVGSYHLILSSYALSLGTIRRVQLSKWATCGHSGQTSLAFDINFKTFVGLCIYF